MPRAAVFLYSFSLARAAGSNSFISIPKYMLTCYRYTMPQKTKAEIQAELAVIMEALLGASAALDEDPASDQEMSDLDSEVKF